MPTTSKGRVVPSENAAVPVVAGPTTWAFVSSRPSVVITTAEPPASRAPCRRRSAATAGITRAATPETVRE